MTRWTRRKSLAIAAESVSISRRQRQHTRRGAGFTLAEVAVALAIFVFGALAIVRIFPPALDVIRNSENRTTATLLAQGTVERLRRETSLVPDAIYGAPPTFEGAFIGTASRNFSLPPGVLESNFTNSALNYFKQIKGEKQTVRVNTNASSETFVLTQFPYVPYNAAVPLSGVDVYRETTLTGVTITSDGDLYQDGVPLAAGNYYVSYRWRSGGATAGGVVDEPVIVTATSARVLRGGTGNIDSGPVAVRQRQLLTATPASDARFMLGYVPVPGVSAGDIVSLDYTVEDWRWLVDDRVPAAIPGNQEMEWKDQDAEFQDSPSGKKDWAKSYAMPRSTLLPVRHIDKEFQENPPFVFMMLTQPGTSTTVEYPAPLTGYVYNSKKGRIIFDVGANSPTNPVPTAKRARVVYRATNNWTRQLSVAARSYIPYVVGRDTTVSPQEPWREYSWDPVNDPNYLYFHPNEAGKTILVTYQFGSPLQTRDNLVTINEELIDAPSTVLTGFESSRKVARVAPFLDSTGNLITASAVLAVRGLAVQARTAWISGARYSQSVVTDYRPINQS